MPEYRDQDGSYKIKDLDQKGEKYENKKPGLLSRLFDRPIEQKLSKDLRAYLLSHMGKPR